MNRIFLIAKRDYLQTLLSKAYLIGLVFLPLIFGGGFLITSIASRGNTKDQRIIVIDHTGVSSGAVIQAAEEANRKGMFNAATGLQVMPRFIFEAVNPAADEAAQLLTLCDRIRKGDVFLVLDLAHDALMPSGNSAREPVRYYTNAAGFDRLMIWFPAAINDGLRRVRLTQIGVDLSRIPDALRQVDVVSMNLAGRDSATGRVVQGGKRNLAETTAVPFFLVFLLVMVVMVGSTPHLGAVAEDKMQRVFEMLLCSASSFELMMGKVIAALAASLTSSIFYVIGGLLVMSGMAMFGLAPLNLLPWFFVYLIADVLMLSALGVALGAACGTPQDAQSLAFLLFMPIMIPMFMLTPIMQHPNGAFSTAMSFIPPFTPIVMLLRQALPGGVPWWQPWVGMVGVIAWAVAIVWAAARIFRIGILSQGKAPKLAELAQWVWRG